LRGSYQSASKALQTLQNLSGIKTRQAIATLKSLPSGRASAPSSNLMEETATVHPGHQLRSPINMGSFSSIPNKLPLIIGVSTATLVIIAVTLSVIRKPSPSVVATGNQTNLASEPNKTNSTPNSNQSSSKPDPNKSDSTPEPNKTNSTPDPDKSQDPNNCTFVMSRSSNVRESAKSKKTGKVLEAGTKLTVTGKEQDGWLEISSPEQGWVWKSRTKKTCPPSQKADFQKSDDSSKKNNPSKNND